MSIRERALKEELWCAVKHLLCAEEHIIESVQKLIREAKEIDGVRDSLELLMIADSVRALRQRLVDVALGVESELREHRHGEDTGNTGEEEKRDSKR